MNEKVASWLAHVSRVFRTAHRVPDGINRQFGQRLCGSTLLEPREGTWPNLRN